MDRRAALLAIGLGTAFPDLCVSADTRGKVYRIGNLLPDAPDPKYGPWAQALHDSLRSYGYEEGKNLVMERRWANGDVTRLPGLAAELVALHPDVLLCTSTPAGKALKEATQTIPIVVIVSGDPVATGLVASLAAPGGNVTGSTLMNSEISAKRVELVRDLLPDARDVALLTRPDTNPGVMLGLLAMIKAAKTLGLRAHRFDVHSAAEIELAFRSMARAKVHAVVMDDDPEIIYRKTGSITELALRYRIPAFGDIVLVEAGALVGFDADIVDLYRRTGYFVDKIVKGTKPNVIPVQGPTKFELVLNLRTAKTLGFRFPTALLQRADRVIQ